MGTGHVMRCLTLATEWRTRGVLSHFICRPHAGNLIALIRERGFPATELHKDSLELRPARDLDVSLPAHADWVGCDWQTDAEQMVEAVGAPKLDWLVVDHYGLDVRWERILRQHVRRIMVIDDLADRQHDCDLLLDQNYYSDTETRYRGLLPQGCKTLLGPSYVLLRPEFIQARSNLRQRDGSVRRILVFFGGSDPSNQTRHVLSALARLPLDGHEIMVDVVIGASHPGRDELQEQCKALRNVSLHCQVSNMAELIRLADLGLGAGGTAMWERCYLGLPTITVVFAENQVRTTEDVARSGGIKYLGRCNSFTGNEYEQAIKAMLDSPGEMKRMAHIAMNLVRPGTQAVADQMIAPPSLSA
jgi:UDP-2,4-diacetamido-2,4,6-trideoxy-beta-L-altropyranose hydrolase